MPNSPTILNVRFFRTEAGNEPVREWLTDLPREARRLIGTDIKTVQLGWPIGMPVVRKLESGLWEVRTSLADTIARVIFTVGGSNMILLHGFINRLLKNVGEAVETRRKQSKKRSLHRVNEHFEAVFNAVSAT